MIDSLSNRAEKLLGRICRSIFRYSFFPSCCRQKARYFTCRFQIGQCHLIICEQIAKPFLQAAYPPAPAIFAAPQPQPHLGCFKGGQRGTKGAICSIKNMMSLIKNIACWAVIIADLSHGSIDHHQRMIGDHNIGMTGHAHRFFHKTFMIMDTGRMDTFPAPVCQTSCLAMA